MNYFLNKIPPKYHESCNVYNGIFLCDLSDNISPREINYYFCLFLISFWHANRGTKEYLENIKLAFYVEMSKWHLKIIVEILIYAYKKRQ